jgi:antitoxin ParD1/3/4/toxin ParE1/3/4
MGIHIRERSNDGRRADAVIGDITAAFRRLVLFPYSGSVHDDVLAETYRFWPVHSWEIIYRPDTDPLEIVRNLPRVLR